MDLRFVIVNLYISNETRTNVKRGEVKVDAHAQNAAVAVQAIAPGRFGDEKRSTYFPLSGEAAGGRNSLKITIE